MAEQTVTAPNNVSSAYEDFLESFRGIVEDSNLSLALPVRPIRSSFVVGGDSAQAVFNWSLYLKGWPCRQLPRGKRLDIIVKALETFLRQSWQMTKSTVYVNYILVTGEEAKLAQALHYDFVEEGQADHPFFHVQLINEPLSDVDLRSTGFELTLVRPEESNCWVTTRIPTPDMTLASVLYCLVADHLGAARFAQFSATVRSIENRLPPPSFASIMSSLQRSPSHFKSSHWFAHMEVDQAQVGR